VSANGFHIGGSVDPRFGRVRDAFADNLASGADVGAACCVYVRGRVVVDLWGGWADRDRERPWTEDTAALVFSSTKGVTAACALRLVEHGLLDLDAPIAAYWPEFSAEGKGEVPVRWALSHRAGVPAIDAELTLDEVLAWHPIVTAIAAQRPSWRPGSRHGHHFRSYGWIVGELVRRVTGRRFGRVLAEEMTAPLGADFWVGLPAAAEPRVARLIPPPPLADPDARAMFERLTAPDTLLGRALTGPSNLFHYDDMWNTRALHAAEMPSSNGIGTARALARIYAALVSDVDGVRLLRPETIAGARAVQSDGSDAVLGLPTRFGTGFMLPPSLSIAAAPAAFGHPGAGGSLGLADAEAELGFGYVMNQMQLGLTGDPRSARLLQAAYESLG
jgi:CubicO group peptidase (beta-lactamase class C family)